MDGLRGDGADGRSRADGFAILNDGVAIIEMSAASGLALTKPETRNPELATTYGTGELVRAALDAGCREFLIGLGGSATNDGGAGMAQALGVSLRDAAGRELPFGGAALERLCVVDVSGMDPRLADCRVTVASDVQNVLCGPQGASRVYGPQKGATPEMAERLDRALLLTPRRCARSSVRTWQSPGCRSSRRSGRGAVRLYERPIPAGHRRGTRAAGLRRTGSKRRSGHHGRGPNGRSDAVRQGTHGRGGDGKAAGRHSGLCVLRRRERGRAGAVSARRGRPLRHRDGPITLQESSARAEELLERTAESVVRTVLAAQRRR